MFGEVKVVIVLPGGLQEGRTRAEVLLRAQRVRALQVNGFVKPQYSDKKSFGEFRDFRIDIHEIFFNFMKERFI